MKEKIQNIVMELTSNLSQEDKLFLNEVTDILNNSSLTDVIVQDLISYPNQINLLLSTHLAVAILVGKKLQKEAN